MDHLVISRLDNVVVMETQGSKGNVEVGRSIKMTHELIRVDRHMAKNEIRSQITYINGNGGCDNLVRVILSGVNVYAQNNKISVTDADKILVLMQVKPWRAPLPVSQSVA